MKQKNLMSNTLLRAVAAVVVTGITTTVATATEPCGELGECKALVEMNTTDGDIGFHFLADGDDLTLVKVEGPDGEKVFQAKAHGDLKEQFFTETFVESAEPLCWADPEADPDDEIVTLEDFLELWTPGTYVFTGRGDEGARSEGETELTYELPAAPAALAFDGSLISWAAGLDLGECATEGELDVLSTGPDAVLPMHPKDVAVDTWEVVFEPDVDDGDPLGQLKFTIRVAGDIATKEVTVPAEYLASLPAGTPAKIEVGAIGGEDNATFTEIFDICVTATGVCPP